ncbi:MAG: lipocalin family protein [Treponemataceae bacterium]|nr:lipocalin family protein [Treponemataceae bacterium]
MKKFAKLSAVFAALVLVLSCFVACSNGDDDSASVQALQGLWIYEDDVYGFYIAGNTLYYAILDNTTWYYDKEEADKFSVSGNKITLHYYDEDKYYEDVSYFEINGDTLILKHYDEKDGSLDTDILKKSAEKPKGISSKQFDEIYNRLNTNQSE